MNPNQTSAGSARTPAGSKGRTERPSGQPGTTSLRAGVRNLIARIRSWLDKPVSIAAALLDKVPVLGDFLRLRVAWVLMIFVVGFAAGTAWQSSGGGRRGAAYERLKAMSLDLAAARKNLDKLANDLGRLEAAGVDAPPRRSR